MKKILLFIIVTSVAIALLAGCQTQSNTSADNSQETIIPTDVERAVVLDFGILDIMDALDVDVELAIPVSNIPSYLEKYSDATNAGDIKEPDLEVLFDFEPDVIFIGGRQLAYQDQLSEIAPTIFVELNGDTYIEDFTKNVGYVAEVFGKEDEAKEALDAINNKIEEVKEIASQNNDEALVLLSNDGAISVFGRGSRFAIIHDVLGVKEADDNIEMSTHGMTINYEYIVDINPDIIFVVDRTLVMGGTDTASTVLDNELVNGTNAAKNGRIVSLDPNIWYLSGGGITSVNEMIENVKGAME